MRFELGPVVHNSAHPVAQLVLQLLRFLELAILQERVALLDDLGVLVARELKEKEHPVLLKIQILQPEVWVLVLSFVEGVEQLRDVTGILLPCLGAGQVLVVLLDVFQFSLKVLALVDFAEPGLGDKHLEFLFDEFYVIIRVNELVDHNQVIEKVLEHDKALPFNLMPQAHGPKRHFVPDFVHFSESVVAAEVAGIRPVEADSEPVRNGYHAELVLNSGSDDKDEHLNLA